MIKSKKIRMMEQDAKLIAKALLSMDDSPFMKVTVSGMIDLSYNINELIMDEKIFGYYYSEGTTVEDAAPVICKILYNYFKAIESLTTVETRKYWMTKKGFEILFTVFPYLYKKGLTGKSLKEEYFKKELELLPMEEIHLLFKGKKSSAKIVAVIMEHWALNMHELLTC